MRLLPAVMLTLCSLFATSAHAFCGFYVASGDAKLFNHASQVALVRDEDRTVLTMASDFKGSPSAFALVVPVPTVLQRGQIHVAERGVLEHLDAFSAPRLVEYTDPDPCAQNLPLAAGRLMMRKEAAMGAAMDRVSEKSRGVTIEARYTVGEYDILILSATQSQGLTTWLREHGYQVPAGAARVLSIYLKQGMKFFVAKVNLGEQARLGFSYLRPLQIAYESPKFMLPVRLGMANADGPQELFVYAVTKQGRVEPTNYRNVRMPADAEVPEFVQQGFAHFYRDLFTHQTALQGMGVVFTEYAWDMTWCDPCAAPPLSADELRQLGVWWVQENGPTPVFLTRLHARYDRASFPEDLMLQTTADRTNFQGRFIVRHEWKGSMDCAAARAYRAQLKTRRALQAHTLAALTGWSLADIRQHMAVGPDFALPGERTAWWDGLWTR